MSFWNYRGRCTGRIIHFLYHYAGLHIAEHAIIGPDFVKYPRDMNFATYRWSDDFGRCDVPTFEFVNDTHGVFAKAQSEKLHKAISDGCKLDVPKEGRIPVDVEILKVLLDKKYWSADLYCHGLHKVQPRFFIREHRLFMQAKDWVYAWMPEANNWAVWVEGKSP